MLIRVLAAVIQRGDRYLLCKRPRNKRHGGLWEFPGGKLEPGESLQDAAQRELSEELDVLATSSGEPLFTVRDAGSPYEIIFVPVEISGEPRAVEHEDLRWATLSDIDRLKMAPSDGEFAREFLRRNDG